ncbi:unnamed protein product [Closterium sp. NIES-54]
MADPSGGPVVARSSTVLPCLAVSSSSLSGLHLPSFSTNLVSTAALHDAMVTTTTPGGQRVLICTYTWTGRHLATFTRQPGSSVYTLASEPPQVATSAQVSASGQVAASCSCRLLSHQTLLWHHRLGHPSLPRLRGMHSSLLVSGLPRSLPPLPPSLAPPCLPCIEGRQRAAPHSSSFPPTTAPLQTLHMDVWGLARVSGQGRERYFLLVVDDYTRYTTVFPLRSNSEVVDVLIPWIRTVRLRLRKRFGQDLPVLRLHSERGGEFSSNLLRDFFRGEGILQSFTLLDSPQQNGIAERRIGLVMEVARTSMIHAAAPHFLWPFTIRYAAHQLNLWPRVSLPETSPTLHWTGKVGDASVFRVWGSRAFVRDTSADKLSARAIPCDVTFDESVPFYHLFPYCSAPPPPSPLFLAPSPPPVDPLPPQGPAPLGVSHVDPLSGTVPIEVAVGSRAASRDAEPGGAGSEGTGSGGVEPGGEEPGGAEPEGVEPGGAESEGVESGGVEPRGAGDTGARGAGVTAGAGGTRGIAATGLGGACTRGNGVAGTGGVGDTGAGDPTEPGAAGAGGFGAGGAGARGAGVGGTGAGGAGATGAGAADTGAGGIVRPRLYFVPLLQQVLGVQSCSVLLPQVDSPPGAMPGEVAVDSGATRGAGPRDAETGGAVPVGAETGGAEPGGVETGGAEPGGAEPEGVELGGAESKGAESGGAKSQGAASFGATGAGGAGAAGVGGAGVTAGAGVTRGTSAIGPGGARTRGTGAAGIGGVGGARARDPTESGAARTGGSGAGGAGAGGAGVEGTGAGCAGVGGTGAGGAGAGGAGAVVSGGTVRPRQYIVPLLQQVLSVPSSTSLTPPLLCPPPDQPQLPIQPASPLPTPSPYTEQFGGLEERCEPASRPVLPVRTARRVPRSRPPPVPGTHAMALRPSSVPQRIPLPVPHESSLSAVPDLESDRAHATSPTVSRLLATAVTDPSFESAAVSALVAELLDIASACRLDYATALVAESASAIPPSVGGECALGTNVLEDRQEDFESLAAPVPRFAFMLLAPEGDPDAPDILTPRSYAKAITGLSQRQGVYYFQTFSPTPKMTTLRVLLHIAAQRDYDLHSLDFSTAFLQGSIHEEIWLRRPPGFTGSFPAGTQWSLRRSVYGLRQAPREWHNTLRSTLAALGFAPSTAYPSLFLRTDTSLPPFYVLVYVDGLVFATADTEALTLPSGPYPELVGCLMYLMTCTRPDLAYPLSLVVRYVAPARHRKVHWDAAKRVLRYLCSTSGMGLVLGGPGPVVLTSHADAFWVDDSATQRLSQGYTFSLGSGSVSWRSTGSSLVLSSSCEAEIYAGAMAAQELRWLTYLLTNWGEQPRSPPVVYVDNKAMIALCQEHRTKHIALRYFFSRELQQRGQLRLVYVSTRANTADVFTKALPPGDHQRFSTVLGLVPTLPHLLTA